jgi:hypothetical protein
MQPENQSGNLALRLCLQTGIWLAVMAGLLFGGAASWHWPQAWTFLAIFGIGSGVFGLWLLKRDPALLEARLGSLASRASLHGTSSSCFCSRCCGWLGFG